MAGRCHSKCRTNVKAAARRSAAPFVVLGRRTAPCRPPTASIYLNATVKCEHVPQRQITVETSTPMRPCAPHLVVLDGELLLDVLLVLAYTSAANQG